MVLTLTGGNKMEMEMDIYALTFERSVALVRAFVDRWLSGFVESAEEYEFPQYSDNPTAIYCSVMELIEKLVEKPNEKHSIYWRNPGDAPLSNGMLFFTDDGAMIVGLTVDVPRGEQAGHILSQLARSVNGQFGYCTYEEPPPHTSSEFIRIARTLPPPKILDGALIS